ncbi:MAG: serine/threonine-protein kinase, partial [Iamia sp.]
MAALTPDSLDGSRDDAAAEPGPDGVLPPGSALDGGRYRLGAPLGRGGFGITYLADDLRLQRPVAIKELFPDSARRSGWSVVVPGEAAEGFARARQRFLREATTLARFGHPSIVRIFGVFEEHGTAYLVLERLEGQTLGEELRRRRGPFSEAEALDVAGQVAAALWVVHRAGVLHRDVSPTNLVRTDDGRIVLIDFGLARPFADDHTTSMTRIVTPGYAPPEQYAGAARFSTRADVYALGATLHRLLSGQVPPDASARQRGMPLAPLWRLNPTVSRRVSDAVGAALALDSADRPPTVRHLLDRLGVPTDDLGLDDGADDAADTELVGPSTQADDAEGPTELVAPHPSRAASPSIRTEAAAPVAPSAPWPAPSAPGTAPSPAVRPASHVLPAPGWPAGAAAARPAAPVAEPIGGPPRRDARRLVGSAPPGRAWLTLPLAFAAMSIASAQPATISLLLGLGVAPLLATAGDRVLRPHRSAGWLAAWWPRNLLVGAVRSLGGLVVLAFGLCLW